MAKDPPLGKVAEAVGLQVDWTDASGQHQTLEPTVVETLLGALGYPATSAAERRESLAKAREDRDPVHAPLITADVGRAVRLGNIAIDAERVRIVSETGEEISCDLRRRRDGLYLSAIRDPGYYQCEAGGRQLTIAVAPRRSFGLQDCTNQRAWGSAVQIYSMRSDGADPGFGGFAEVRGAAQRLGEAGAEALAVSPCHALFTSWPGRASPYSPSSRLFLNVLYSDPAVVLPGLDLPPQSGGSAASDDLIDWETAGAAKLQWLRRVFEVYRSSGSAEAADFVAFRKDRGEPLERHARFETLHNILTARGLPGDWRQWPAEYRNPASQEVSAFAAEHSEEVAFHLFLQWLADRSLASANAAARDSGMAVGLIADMAVGIDPAGSEAWSRPQQILQGLSVGAPPDLLGPLGQNWGVTSFSPRGLLACGFESFIETLRTGMRQCGGLRIDHAMALRRLWLVPEGETADHGGYLTYPLDDLLRLVALESHRHRAIVVGEDLGTVPEGFREKLDEKNILGMRVLFFEQDEDGYRAPDAWSPDAVAMTTTHDLPTVAGWWSGRDIEWRDKVGHLPDGAAPARKEREKDRKKLWDAIRPGKKDPAPIDDIQPVVDAAVEYVAETACRLAIVPMEDLAGLVEQPNLPGTIDEHPNWRRRLPIDAFDLAAPRIKRLSQKRSRP